MFVGHYAVAFAAKRAAPRTSLGTLVAAAITLDMLWPVFVLLGWERYTIGAAASPFLAFRFDHYPWSHSLLAAFVWATLGAALYQRRGRYGAGALTVWALVVSHWVLDALVHRPDMPITPGSPVRVGLGIWASPAGTVALELALLAVGLALYLGATRARGRGGVAGLWAFVAILLLSFVMTAVEPPNPAMSHTTIGVVGLAGGTVMVALAAWLDRQRAPRVAG